MALAGLWENWKSPADEWVRSFTIIMTTPNELCAPIQNRMPVILPPKEWPLWLGEDAAEPERLKAVLRPTRRKT
jgi:putative SOS response-associated peptidase YedK